MDEMNRIPAEETSASVEKTAKEPGKNAAIASLVLGIIAVVLWFFGITAVISVILGIVGLILAGNAKKAGYLGGVRTAGFVLSLIGLIGGGIAFVACVAFAGIIGSAASSGALDELESTLNSLQ